MHIGDLIQALWRRRTAVAVTVAVGFAVGFIAIFRVQLGVPPHVEKRPLETGAGTTQMVLDSPRAPILKAGIPLDGLTNRAAVLTDFIQNPRSSLRISARVGIPVEEIATRGAPPFGLSKGREIEADQRATELTAESKRRTASTPSPRATRR